MRVLGKQHSTRKKKIIELGSERRNSSRRKKEDKNERDRERKAHV